MNNSQIKLIICGLLVSLCFNSHTLAQKDAKFAGYAYSKVDQQQIEFSVSGFADKKNKVLYDTLTVQNIGSISKTFIGISIMMAKERGLIDLDTDINEYLDFKINYPRGDEEFITLRHLATHTSGVRDKVLYYTKAYFKGKVPEMTLREYLKNYLTADGSAYSKNNFNEAAVGTYYEYSNIGAALAAYVIEYVTKTKFSDFTRINILEPLGMQYSGWFYAEIDESQHAKLYKPNGKAADTYTLITYPDGGFRTNIIDLSIYLQEIIRGFNHDSELLSNESWDELFKKQFQNNRPVNRNEDQGDSGIFFAHTKYGTIGHTGSDPGVTTVMRFDPNTLEGKVLMTNSEVTRKTSAAFREIWDSI